MMYYRISILKYFVQINLYLLSITKKKKFTRNLLYSKTEYKSIKTVGNIIIHRKSC